MMTESKKKRVNISLYVRNRNFQVDIAQIRAKATLSEILKEVPPYNWNYFAPMMIKNATFLTFELEDIARTTPDEIEKLSEPAKKIAQLWESMAQLKESTSRNSALLNAAVTYELAGYQANAMCIAKKIRNPLIKVENPLLIDLASLFLQRRLIQLKKLSKQVQHEPKIDFEITLVEKIALGLTGRAFSRVLEFFLGGKESAIKESIETFQNAQKIYSSLSLVEETNLLHSLISLIFIMKKRSIWTHLRAFSPSNPKWIRYLKLLSRGLGSNLLQGVSISELWRSQITAIKNGLLHSTSSKIIKMPTSAGKTRIAEIAIIHTLVNNPGAKCIYIAPYLALISELQQSFMNLINNLGYRVSSIIGAFESDEFEDLLFRKTDILISTPEKLDLLLRSHPDFFNEVKLIVIDEAQIVNDPGRGIKFELLITRLKKKLSSVRFLTLSAVISEETLRDFADWFNVSQKNDIIISDYRPAIQRYSKFEWNGDIGTIRFVSEDEINPDDEVNILSEFIPGVLKQELFEYVNPRTGRVNHERFPKNKTNKSQIAAELALKFVELGSVLIFCSTTRSVKYVTKALQRRLELMSLSGKSIPSRFQDSEKTRSYLLAREWLGEDHYITKALKRKIAVHHGRLPDILRKAIETDFRQKKFEVLIATNTLANGVNLPIRTVIIHSCLRGIDEYGNIIRIPARDYWNIAGRAGRAGEETEGLIVHITRNFTDERLFEHYKAHRTNVEPLKSALYPYLIGLMRERLSEDELNSLERILDPEILALLVEESIDTVTSDYVKDIIDQSLIKVQATRKSYPIQPLEAFFSRIITKFREQIPDKNLRVTYSSTGLSTVSCQIIHEHILKNEEKVQDLLLSGDRANLDEIIELFVPVCLDLFEMQSTQEFAGNYIDLLKRWINGYEISDILEKFKDQTDSAETLGRIIDDMFRYRLSWGLSGYIRIAMELKKMDKEDISTFTKFLPSMVKYGVPDPIACWAMTIGIPIRRIAIEIAAKYRDEVESYDYENFLEWLNTLGSERLLYEFNLKSPLLEDISRFIYLSCINPHMTQYTSINEFLPKLMDIRGIRYENRSDIAVQVKKGDVVELARDYYNLIDTNAISVNWFNQQIGYIPREYAQILAPEMDTSITLKAEVIEVDKSKKIPHIIIRVHE